MFLAQCPHCNTIFQTAFSVLGPSGGRVTCGECKQLFNAFDHPYAPAFLEEENASLEESLPTVPMVEPPSLSEDTLLQEEPVVSPISSPHSEDPLEHYLHQPTMHEDIPVWEDEAEQMMPAAEKAATLAPPDLSFLLLDPESQKAAIEPLAAKEPEPSVSVYLEPVQERIEEPESSGKDAQPEIASNTTLSDNLPALSEEIPVWADAEAPAEEQPANKILPPPVITQSVWAAEPLQQTPQEDSSAEEEVDDFLSILRGKQAEENKTPIDPLEITFPEITVPDAHQKETLADNLLDEEDAIVSITMPSGPIPVAGPVAGPNSEPVAAPSEDSVSATASLPESPSGSTIKQENFSPIFLETPKTEEEKKEAMLRKQVETHAKNKKSPLAVGFSIFLFLLLFGQAAYFFRTPLSQHIDIASIIPW